METKKYDSILAANYLLATAYDKGIVLNVTKVQKMLFMAYGVIYAKHNRIFIDESPKAWPFGPVFPKTRSKVDYGTLLSKTNPIFDEISKDDIVNATFDTIIDKYSKYSASQLSNWSHMPDSPWDKTKNEKGFEWNKPIDDQYIKEYFTQNNV